MELWQRLNDVSALQSTFPYSFFGTEIQGAMTGGQTVGGKPAGYYPNLNISGKFAGVS